jgi:hypothetical protein
VADIRAYVLTGLAAAIGAVGVVGAITGRPALASWTDPSTTMRLSTALAVLASCFQVYGQVRLLWALACGAAVAALVLAPAVFILPVPRGGQITTYPCVGTSVMVVAVSSSGFIEAIHRRRIPGVCMWVGAFVVSVAATATIGHATSVPILYFEVPSFGPGVSIPSAVAFLLLGLVNLILSRRCT